WKKGVKDLYWTREKHIMDFDLGEEQAEIVEDFEKDGYSFLIAHDTEFRRPCGAVGIKYGEGNAVIRRWEPAIIPEYRKKGVSELLLDKALEYLRKANIPHVEHRMKHPIEKPQLVKLLISLYQSRGFRKARPDNVGLLAQLKGASLDNNSNLEFPLQPGHYYTDEEWADFVLKAFTSTPQDRELHGLDPSVSERDVILSMKRRLKTGSPGPSPPELWNVAAIDENPVGFVGGFILERKNRPVVGVLGPIGVFPEFRRTGIARQLVVNQLATFKELGCEYSYVGTGQDNSNAIALYTSVGYDLIDRQILLHLDL
ncbi:MAG: GNAT family N-acetyltransferase, partial [Candidatus Thorarchaeota archaeon]